MKTRILMLAVGVFGFLFAKAADPNPPCAAKGKKNDLAGVVFHADNKKPLKDVSVTAYLVSSKEKSVRTDEIGSYAFDELKPGTYKFVFEKAGFKRVTKDKVVVRTDEAFQLNIEMIESREYDVTPSPLHFTDF